MKSFLISLMFATILIGGMIILNVRIPVRYSQFFADKHITLTETLTWGEKILTLPHKKGFIRYEE